MISHYLFSMGLEQAINMVMDMLTTIVMVIDMGISISIIIITTMGMVMIINLIRKTNLFSLLFIKLGLAY